MYGVGVDIWAVGCILAELFKREPLFPGDSDLDTLDKIITIVGTPNEKNWHGVTELPDFVEFNEVSAGQPFSEKFSALEQDALDILESMLRLNPNDRCTTTQALKMPYFKTEPFPTVPEFLPHIKDYETKKESDDFDSVPIKMEPIGESDVKPTKAKRLKFE